MAAESAAKKEAAPDGAKGGAGDKKPILLYALVVLNMLVVAGVGFMVQVGRKKDAAQPNINAVIKGEHETQVEEKKKEEEEVFVGKMIPLEMFLVNLSGSRGRKLLKVAMELEVEGEKVQEEIEKRKPQIRDMIIIILSSKTYDQVSVPDGKDKIKQEITDQINRFLSHGKIRRVLFTDFIWS